MYTRICCRTAASALVNNQLNISKHVRARSLNQRAGAAAAAAARFTINA